MRFCLDPEGSGSDPSSILSRCGGMSGYLPDPARGDQATSARRRPMRPEKGPQVRPRRNSVAQPGTRKPARKQLSPPETCRLRGSRTGPSEWHGWFRAQARIHSRPPWTPTMGANPGRQNETSVPGAVLGVEVFFGRGALEFPCFAQILPGRRVFFLSVVLIGGLPRIEQPIGQLLTAFDHGARR